MNNKAFTISLALAGMAVFMIYSYISSKEQEYKTKYGAETAVIVAKTTIKEMDEIHGSMVEIINMPKQFIEPGKTTSKEEVEGMVALVPIRKGEQITQNKFSVPGMRTGLARQVTPGKRAVSLPVSNERAVSRLLKPGDRIDVMATVDPPGGVKGSQIAKIVLQDVPVLAVGEWVVSQAPRRVDKDDTGSKDVVRNLSIDRNYDTITIEVDANEAMRLVLLRAAGMPLDIMLRNNDDTDRLAVGGMTLLDVLGPDSAKIIRAPSTQR